MTRSYAEVLINGMKINKINKGYTSIMFLDLLVQRSWFIGSAVSIFLNQVFETFVDMELSHEYRGKKFDAKEFTRSVVISLFINYPLFLALLVVEFT